MNASRPRLLLPLAALLFVAAVALAVDWFLAVPPESRPRYVGRDSCIRCHSQEYDRWHDSHHDLAMDLATPETVLGDFADTEFTHNGVTSSFTRRDGQFYVTTDGPNGGLETFPVKYTFGVDPLQQYLIEFDDGRVQCLSVAWDTKGKRWFHLYPDEQIPHDDVLHWTANAQNWNYMCAECHSTDLKKNYDLATDTYHTTFSEIDVSCEACHGPGEHHIQFAESWSPFWDRNHGYGLARLKTTSTKPQLDTCAPCHSRRRIVHPDYTAGEPYLDYYSPQLIVPDLYFPDGQIRDEVYVYGSFLQSKMYRKDVRCTDCHDPHSGRTYFSDNQLCAKCHVPAKYDTPAHHFHPVGSTGASCVECHMPERTYMVVDPRRDHSIRVPRPDLSVELDTPNACNNCHDDKTPQWAAEHFVNWYGQPSEPKPHFAHAFHADDNRLPTAASALRDVASDSYYAPIVRASALRRLTAYPAPENLPVLDSALDDADPLIRGAAVPALAGSPPNALVRRLTPALADPVRLVRTEAARLLSELPDNALNSGDRQLLEAALDEYRAGQHAVSDRAGGHLNLGVIAANQGDTTGAIEHYRTALRVEPDFVPARINLAMLLAVQNQREEAEQLFREAIELAPELLEAKYSLALLLAEDPTRFDEAVQWFAAAAQPESTNPRVFYNYGLALQQQNRLDEAESALRTAYDRQPQNPDFVHALVIFYMQRGDWDRARRFVDLLVSLVPPNPELEQLARQIRRQAERPATVGPAFPQGPPPP